MTYYTYAYLREDGTPYYIGKGSGERAYRRTKKCIKPPKDKTRIIILKNNLTENQAFRHEKYMIYIFGRRDLNTGILHNRTDGGDQPPPFKNKKHKPETIEKLRELNRGKKYRLGHKLPPEKLKPKKQYIKKGNKSKNLLKGERRTRRQKEASNKHSKYMLGSTPTNSKEVIIFNKYYKSIRQACIQNNISYSQYKILINSSIKFNNSKELKDYIWNERNKKISKYNKKIN
jgi:hypothetical protein